MHSLQKAFLAASIFVITSFGLSACNLGCETEVDIQDNFICGGGNFNLSNLLDLLGLDEQINQAGGGS